MAQDSQEFLSNDLSHPNHRKAITVLILALVLFGFLLAYYFSQIARIQTSSLPPPNPLSARQALLNQPNPPVNLTPTEITTMQKLLNTPNPTVKLTPQQIKAKQSILSNI